MNKWVPISSSNRILLKTCMFSFIFGICTYFLCPIYLLCNPHDYIMKVLFFLQNSKVSVCLVRLTYPIGKAVDSQTLIELFTMITVLGYGELSRKKLNSISVFLSARELKPWASSDHFSCDFLSIEIWQQITAKRKSQKKKNVDVDV